MNDQTTSNAAPGDSGDQGKIALAGAVYPSRHRQPDLMRAFADELKEQGWRVGGIVQEVLKDGDGNMVGIDAIEIDTGNRFEINRPTESDRENKTCSLNTLLLAEAGGALDLTIRSRADVVLIEKFGEQEQQGGGLADEILRSVSEGIPTLVAVPSGVRNTWREFTGEMGEEVDFDLEEFRSWWQRVQPRTQE